MSARLPSEPCPTSSSRRRGGRAAGAAPALSSPSCSQDPWPSWRQPSACSRCRTAARLPPGRRSATSTVGGMSRAEARSAVILAARRQVARPIRLIGPRGETRVTGSGAGSATPRRPRARRGGRSDRADAAHAAARSRRDSSDPAHVPARPGARRGAGESARRFVRRGAEERGSRDHLGRILGGGDGAGTGNRCRSSGPADGSVDASRRARRSARHTYTVDRVGGGRRGARPALRACSRNRVRCASATSPPRSPSPRSPGS